MRKLIALAFSDLHLNWWSKFNKGGERTRSHLYVLKYIMDLSLNKKVPIFFCGDWIHTGNNMGNIDMMLYNEMTSFYDLFSGSPKLRIFGINGNHDLPQKNTFTNPTKGYISSLAKIYPWMKDMDFKSLEMKDFVIHGIPYIDENVDMKLALNNIKLSKDKPNILLIHTDYKGARDTNGRIIDSVENLSRIKLRKFDLVLCGHIHKYQKLDKNVYMVGAPLQQRFTDEGNKMGYLEIYSDMSVKFKHIKLSPEFLTVKSNEDILDDGNYYRIRKIKSHNIVEEKKKNYITRNHSKEKIVKRYLRVKGIKDKRKKNLLIKVIKESEDD